MADSVVSFLLSKMGAIVEEERQLLGGVGEDIAYVRDELQHMAAFLRVAEATEESNPQVIAWVNQVRDIAFDVEDVLDEFRLRLAPVRRAGFRGFLSKATHPLRSLKCRHEIATKLRDIRSRIARAAESHRRYESTIQGRDLTYTAANDVCYERRADALLLEEGDLVGIEKPKQQIIQWLTETEPAIKIISVVGMGGLGKTALVKRVYDDAGVKKHFDNHVWVTVSQSFNINEFLKDVIVKLHEEIKQPTPPTMETMPSHDLKGIIKEFLKESKYLLVLDDVWQAEAWDSIKYALPQNNYGSRVMLTTRSAEVASTPQIDFNCKVFPLDSLSFQDSWTLFCRKTFRESECPSNLKNICEQVVLKCGGLPLAIGTISGLLAAKDKSRTDEWELVKRNLGGELESSKLQGLKKILLLSYYDLPFFLRACVLHLTIFPEDYGIERMRLIRLWIAENFVVEEERRTLEEVAESYLNELITRSLIQVVRRDSSGGVRECRIHDIVREVILSKSRDQSFVAICSEYSTRVHERARRLSVHKTFGSVDNLKHIVGLRSLLLFGVADFSSKPTILKSLGTVVRLLTVLDLRGTKLDIFPEDVVKLYHLRYLSLRDTKVEKIPTSIGKLLNLETLDLKRTYVTMLPHAIVSLQQLRHLIVHNLRFVSDDNPVPMLYGFASSLGIGCLLSLQTLCTMTVERGIGIIEELGKLKQLRKLGILGLREVHGKSFCCSLEKLTNLRRLDITSFEYKRHEIIDVEAISSPPQFLQRLVLCGPLRKVPHWIPSLQNLRKLWLSYSAFEGDVLESVHALPNLMELKLDEAFQGERLHFRAETFQKLKVLVLCSLHSLRMVEVAMDAMPGLEDLRIMVCQSLEEVPLGIQNLSKIQALLLYKMSEGLINRIDRTKGGEDFYKVEHIPNVYIGSFEGGKWHIRHL